VVATGGYMIELDFTRNRMQNQRIKLLRKPEVKRQIGKPRRMWVEQIRWVSLRFIRPSIKTHAEINELKKNWQHRSKKPLLTILTSDHDHKH
jgi:hypothetical protein